MTTTPPHFLPEISVAIPMYNVEKYIGACLESLLAQTFQNFEVIIVDDCSTDNSAAIVESYAPKFGGRLSLFKSQVNSGHGMTSDKAINLSRGKYIYCMDSDDLIVNNALEILYHFAEEFGADVVYMDRGFKFISNPENPIPTQEELQMSGWQGRGPFVDKPTLDPEGTAERVNIFCSSQIGWTAWEKLVRRDLLMENEIHFPPIRNSTDVIWTIMLVCCAKRLLRVPFAGYLYRQNPTSNMHSKRTPEQDLIFWMDANAGGLNFLKNWLERRIFFRENPQYKFALLECFEDIQFKAALSTLQKLPPHEACEILKSAFTEKFGGHADLIAYLCTSSNFSRLRFLMANQRTFELENKLKQIQGS